MADLSVYLSDVYEKKRRRRRHAVALLIAGGVLFIVMGSGWSIMNAPFLRITRIEVTGNREVAREDIVALAMAGVLTDSAADRYLGFDHFLVWPDALTADQMRLLPRVREVRVSKNYRDRSLTLSVAERQPFAIWCARRNEPVECFWFDTDGTAFKRAPAAEGNLITVVNDYAQDGIGVGTRVLSDRYLPALFSVLESVEEAAVSVKEMRFEDATLAELKAVTYDGPQLYFSLRFPPTGVAAVLESFRAKNGEGAWRKLEYVDFRSENRAYYR